MKYVVFIFALIISVSAFWFSIKFIKLYIKVKNWNKVTATVISKELFIHPNYSTTRTPYGLKVNYAYSVNNLNYTGHTVYVDELAGGQVNHIKSDAEKRLHKIESVMPVYVNPNDATESVLYCEGVGLYMFVFCMGLLALLIALSKIV